MLYYINEKCVAIVSKTARCEFIGFRRGRRYQGVGGVGVSWQFESFYHRPFCLHSYCVTFPEAADAESIKDYVNEL